REPLRHRHVAQRRFALVAGNGLTNALIGVELPSELVVVTDADSGPAIDLADGGDEPTGDEIEQRRLAGTVGADHTDAVAGLERQRERVEHASSVGPREGDVGEL